MVELLIIIILLYVVYSIPAKNRRIYMLSIKSKLGEITSTVQDQRVSNSTLRSIFSKSKSIENENEIMRIAIHEHCHDIIEKHGELFDRLEDRLLARAVELKYYNDTDSHDFSLHCTK